SIYFAANRLDAPYLLALKALPARLAQLALKFCPQRAQPEVGGFVIGKAVVFSVGVASGFQRVACQRSDEIKALDAEVYRQQFGGAGGGDASLTVKEIKMDE